MRSTRDNLRKFNIRLNIVAPYMTRTPLGDAIPGLWEDLDRRGIPVQEPIWVARCVGTLAADEKFQGNLPRSRSLITGHTLYSAHSQMWEIEDAITRLESEWLGKENARIFDLSRHGPSYFTSKSGL
jgi:NAD(P)-dependent dehydrogenase (short-subunit alcohol dehydrogenase family)